MNTADTTPVTTKAHSAVDDWRAVGDLLALATERLTAPVEGIHHAIADRWFGIAGWSGSRGHAAHQKAAETAYRSIRAAGAVTRSTLGIAAVIAADHRSVGSPWSSPRGASAQAAANALWGDEFERRASPMHTEPGIRTPDGAHIASTRGALARAYPTPTRRLAVFLHGLGKTEHCWHTRVTDTGVVVGMHEALEADGFTPVLVRYNTGARVSDTGAALASLLEEVAANWPTPIDEIALIGHSMGGLVARSALHAGRSGDHTWTLSARHLVALGTPHFGSPIEKGAHLASLMLARTAVSRPLGEFVDGRSAGIKDMRHGSIHREDPGHHGPDATTPVSVVPRLDGVRHHHAASVVTGSASDPIGVLVGDLVVRVTSATGVGPHGRVESDNVRVFGGLNHLAMLHDGAVVSQVREWLAPVPAETMGAKP